MIDQAGFSLLLDSSRMIKSLGDFFRSMLKFPFKGRDLPFFDLFANQFDKKANFYKLKMILPLAIHA